MHRRPLLASRKGVVVASAVILLALGVTYAVPQRAPSRRSAPYGPSVEGNNQKAVRQRAVHSDLSLSRTLIYISSSIEPCRSPGTAPTATGNPPSSQSA
jgi:hypothetical protein